MRTKVKVLLIISLVLTFGMLFGVNSYAKDADPFAEEVFGLIPDSMHLDIKEIEYKKAYENIRDNLISIFEENGLTAKAEINFYGYESLKVTRGEDSADLSISAPNFYESPEYFYESDVSIWDYDGKTMKLSFSTEATDEDKEYVKDIELKGSEYIEVDPDEYFSMDNTLFCENYAKEYFKNQINDSSVDVITELYYWDGSDINTRVNSIRVALFKDGALCEIRTLKLGVTLPVITIPANIKEDAYPDYIKSEIKKYDEEFANGVSSVQKVNASQNGILLNSKLEVDGMYTLLNDNNNCDGYVIARKAETKEIAETDKDTNISLKSNTEVLPAGTTLEVKNISKTDDAYAVIEKALTSVASKFVGFDITLKSENVKVQPSGKVKISIPVPEGYDTSKIGVYRVAEDGTKTEYEVKIESGMVTFETDHFSNYVVYEKVPTTEETAKTETETTTTSSNETSKPADYRPNPDTGRDYSIFGMRISVAAEFIK